VNFALCGAILFVYMSAWFGWAQLKGRNDVADTAWGLGFVLVAWSSMVIAGEPSTHGLIINVLVTIWGIRLAAHIHSRNRKKAEDKRYKDLVPDTAAFRWLVSYVKVFLLQGLLLWIVSLPIQAAHFAADLTNPFGLLAGIGLALWLAGFYFEVRGDYELRRFLARKDQTSKVLDTGLWRYTRHPNYFGEVTLWWGVFMVSLSAGSPLWVVAGPLTITLLILFVSGIPMLERRYKNDPAYQKYASRTSKFFPLPPRQ